MSSIDIKAVPVCKSWKVNSFCSTTTPAKIPSAINMPPPIPKNKSGLLSEIITIIRLRTPKPCLTGLRVEPSLVYIAEMGTSAILRPFAVASDIVSAEIAMPFSLGSSMAIACLEKALNPDSVSESLLLERIRVKYEMTFCPIWR